MNCDEVKKMNTLMRYENGVSLNVQCHLNNNNRGYGGESE